MGEKNINCSRSGHFWKNHQQVSCTKLIFEFMPTLCLTSHISCVQRPVIFPTEGISFPPLVSDTILRLAGKADCWRCSPSECPVSSMTSARASSAFQPPGQVLSDPDDQFECLGHRVFVSPDGRQAKAQTLNQNESRLSLTHGRYVLGGKCKPLIF